MAVPKTRAEFKEYCLRKLGKPVIEINVDDDQVDDRIDEALSYYWDYHFDGAEKQYYKYTVQASTFPGVLSEVIVGDGGAGYANGETITVTPLSYANAGSGAVGTVVTDGAGTITSVIITNHGQGYSADPIVTVNTSEGSGAILQGLRGGYIPLPDNIRGVVNMFPVGQALNTNNLFNIRYQIALNDLYTLTSVSMVPYYMAMQHVQFLESMLVGQQPIRYNRIANRCYIDMQWDMMNQGDYIILEAYQIIDPVLYPKAWAERWLQNYTTCLIKQQWGANLTKFIGMQLPGGVQFNGEKILNDATAEREKLEQEMIYSYSLPITDFIG